MTSTVTDPQIYLHVAARKGEADYHGIVDFASGDLDIVSEPESMLITANDTWVLGPNCQLLMQQTACNPWISFSRANFIHGRVI